MTREELNAYYRQKRAVNPEAAREAERRYRERHPERVKEAQRRYNQTDSGLARLRKWQKANVETRTVYKRQWREAHPEAERANYLRRYQDESTRIGIVLRNGLGQVLRWQKTGKNWRADAKIGAIVGCSRPALIAHLESLFLPGMSWSNYGRKGWHVDHIKPCCTFDLTQHAQVLACFNFRNLRPLWAHEHLRRSKRGNV